MTALFIFDELERMDIRKQRVFRDQLPDGKINHSVYLSITSPHVLFFSFSGQVGTMRSETASTSVSISLCDQLNFLDIAEMCRLHVNRVGFHGVSKRVILPTNVKEFH